MILSMWIIQPKKLLKKKKLKVSMDYKRCEVGIKSKGCIISRSGRAFIHWLVCKKHKLRISSPKHALGFRRFILERVCGLPLWLALRHWQSHTHAVYAMHV